MPFDDSPEMDTWAFARGTSDREVWVLILEKALAKVYGSYEACEGGKPYQAFMMLTNFPTDCLKHKSMNPKDLWDCIEEGVRKRSPICASINSNLMGLNK